MAESHILIEMSDGAVYCMAFQKHGRFPSKPDGGGWVAQPDGTYARIATDANIDWEVERAARQWLPLKVTDWREADDISAFNQNRRYRNAIRMVGGKPEHDMDLAREIHRNILRVRRAEQFTELDAQWTRAIGQGTDAGAIEAKRQELRDAPADPRIDAAQTIDDLKAISLPE